LIKNAGDVGEAIKLCRVKNNWSQQALGNKFNPQKSASEISRWERNEVQPAARHLAELLSILGPQFQELITSKHRQTSQAI
jgi:ribosome-binding protein aMBF1 (putative translation factor)